MTQFKFPSKANSANPSVPMLRIVYDMRHADQSYGGMARYSENLLRGLLASRLEYELVVLADSSRRIEEIPPHRKVQVLALDVPLLRFRHHWQVARVVHNFPGWLYFYPSFDPPCFVRNPTTFVVHDLFPLLVPGHSRWWNAQYYLRTIRHNLGRKNRSCIAVSETTRRDIERWIPRQPRRPIRVVHEASSLRPKQDAPSPSVRALAADSPYLLYVGDRRPQKNIPRMIDIFVELRARGWPGRFLLVGRRENFCFDLEAYARNKEGIAILGPVSEPDLRHLYSGCESLFFLSSYEGFGLPVLEAAGLGRKVITSELGATAEIAPPGSLLLSPDIAPAEGAARILAYLQDPSARPNPDAVHSRFDWVRSAELIFGQSA